MIISDSVQNFISQPHDYSLTITGSYELIAVERKTAGVAVPLLTSKEDFFALQAQVADPTVARLVSVIHSTHFFDERVRSVMKLGANPMTLTPFDTIEKKQVYFLELAAWAEEKIGEPEYAMRCEFARRVSYYTMAYYDPEKADIRFDDLELSEFPECFIKNCAQVLSLKPTTLKPNIAKLPKSLKESHALMATVYREYIKNDAALSSLKEKWIDSSPANEPWIELIITKIAASKIDNAPLDLSGFPKEVVQSAPFDLIFDVNPALKDPVNLILPAGAFNDRSFALHLIKAGFSVGQLTPTLIADEDFLKQLATFSVAKYVELIGENINSPHVLNVIVDQFPRQIDKVFASPKFNDLGAKALVDFNPMLLFVLPVGFMSLERKSEAWGKFRVSQSGHVTGAIEELKRMQLPEWSESGRFDRLQEDSDEGIFIRRKYLAQVSGIGGELDGKKLEGWYPNFFLKAISYQISHHMLDLEDRELISNAVQVGSEETIDHEKLFSDYSSDKPIIIPLGYLPHAKDSGGHAISVVMWKEHFIIANRGNRHESAECFTYFKIDPSKVTQDYFHVLESTMLSTSVEAQTAAIYEIMPHLIVDPSFTPEAKVQVESTLVAKDQSVGNCSCASMKAGFRALCFISELRRGETVDHAAKKSKATSDKLSIALRSHAESLMEEDYSKITDQAKLLPTAGLLTNSKFKNLKKQLRFAETASDLEKILNEAKETVSLAIGRLPGVEKTPNYHKLVMAAYQHASITADQKARLEAIIINNLPYFKEDLPDDLILKTASERPDLIPILRSNLTLSQEMNNSIREALGLPLFAAVPVSLTD